MIITTRADDTRIITQAEDLTQFEPAFLTAMASSVVVQIIVANGNATYRLRSWDATTGRFTAELDHLELWPAPAVRT